MAYTKAAIAIPKVTGDIKITVTTEKAVTSYTNQVPISTDSNGAVYNTTGYKDNYRLSSSAAESVLAGVSITGFIPVKVGDVIRVKTGYLNPSYANVGSCNCWYYDSSKTNKRSFTAATAANAAVHQNVIQDSSGFITQWTLKATTAEDTSISYVRFTFTRSGEGAIVTVNEEISS